MKFTTCSHTIFTWLSSTMKHLPEKFNFEFLHAFNFFCAWNKGVSCCQLNTETFRRNIAYVVNLFVVSLDIRVMINILHEMIKILHERMLKTIYLNWFPSNISKKNNSLDGYSNKPWINGYRFVISPVKLNLSVWNHLWWTVYLRL